MEDTKKKKVEDKPKAQKEPVRIDYENINNS